MSALTLFRPSPSPLRRLSARIQHEVLHALPLRTRVRLHRRLHHLRRERPRPRALPALAVGANAFGAMAIGALSVGAFAIGSFVIGRMGIGQLFIGRLRIKRLEVEQYVPAGVSPSVP